MTTSQISFLSEILDGSPIPINKRAYFQERLKNRLYHLIVSEFQRMNKDKKFTQKDLAVRIGKGTDQINRLLSSPGNWTLDTVSDLLIGIASAELEIEIMPISQRAPRNSHKPQWIINFQQIKNNIPPVFSSNVFNNLATSVEIFRFL